jgi:uncharacterized protein (TIGR00156 family)
MVTRAALAIAILVLGLAGSPATAQFVGSGGGEEISVEEALSTPLNTYVTVTGSILEHLGEEYYLLADDSGEIRVEIPNALWRGTRVESTDTVRIRGEVDEDSEGIYLWVVTIDLVY